MINVERKFLLSVTLETYFNGFGEDTYVVIPEYVTEIGGGAFRHCSNLKSIVIPKSVKRIGYHAFDDCGSLMSINIPEGVTYIGDGAFSGCSSLTCVVIPTGVHHIGSHMFQFCRSLKSVVLPISIESIDHDAFLNCPNLTIYGQKKSYAEKRAKELGIPFKEVTYTFNEFHIGTDIKTAEEYEIEKAVEACRVKSGPDPVYHGSLTAYPQGNLKVVTSSSGPKWYSEERIL